MIGLGISIAAQAGNEKDNTTEKLRGFTKYEVADESFDLPQSVKTFADDVFKIVRGNQITEFDSAASAYRQMEIADQMLKIERGNTATEYQEPEVLNISISEQIPADNLNSQPRF